MTARIATWACGGTVFQKDSGIEGWGLIHGDTTSLLYKLFDSVNAYFRTIGKNSLASASMECLPCKRPDLALAKPIGASATAPPLQPAHPGSRPLPDSRPTATRPSHRLRCTA